MERGRLDVRELARRIEAPTWGLVIIIYGSWLGLTYWWHVLPAIIALPCAAWVSAWHMSLQHELIHGHPTRHPRINAALGTPPLTLWLPYHAYRDAHLLHHRAEYLTDPLEDPESTYLSAEAWRSAGPARRGMLLACNTALGRVLLGPLQAGAQFWSRQAHLLRAGEAPWGIWFIHAAGVCAVMVWVCGVCGIGALTYVACFAYPGTALIMVRSLAEHRAASRPDDRTAVVEHAGLLGLLFLNNNLHVLHHERPSIPWYELPARWRAARAEMLAARQGPVYGSYSDVLRRFALRPHHAGPHPLEALDSPPAARIAAGEMAAVSMAGAVALACPAE